MRSWSPSPPLTATVLAALWLCATRCGVSGCDNGKLLLNRDMPADAVNWNCSLSTRQESTQIHPSIDTIYDPEPAVQMCMDKPISYNHTIPNSGAYRPVKAESGEYLYCPPQRWLNNLHHGATVWLHHPCAPLRDRRLLSALARSCLSDYIITPHPQLSQHMPIALVSWGRTLELSTVATSDVCDWLETTTARRNESGGANHIGKYNLLLTWPAEQRAHPEGHSAKTKESLRQCCEQTISPLLNEPVETELESNAKKESSNKGKGRRIRAAIRERREKGEKESTRDDTTHKSNLLDNQANGTILERTGGAHNDNNNNNINNTQPLEDSPSENRGPSDPQSEGEDVSQSKDPNLNQSHKLSPERTDAKDTNPSADSQVLDDDDVDTTTRRGTKGPEVLNSKDQGADSAVQIAKEISHGKEIPRTQDNKVVDIKERELQHDHKSENASVDSVSKSQSAPEPRKHLDSEPNVQDCDGCTEAPGAADHGLPRTPRTDEAVWAAAALGFLLVLLTLSVLHTRLYRHWRTTPSLYWHDPRQDYDSVEDLIRRRLRNAKRRRKRGRRQECVLLPSSSSSDELL